MSSQEPNPYAAPRARLTVDLRDQEIWRDHQTLVCRRGARFPERCVKCNAPAALPLKRYQLYWHHPGWYVFLLAYVFPYFVVAALAGRRATVRIGLCARHKRRIVYGTLLGWGGFTAIALAVTAGVKLERGPLLGLGMIAFLRWAIATVLTLRIVSAVRIDRQLVRIGGCGSAFLDTLPEHPE